MKTLKTLIRLKKDELDKLQKELAEIQARQQKLKDEHQDLASALAREGEFASQFPESIRAYTAFAKKTLDRQKILMNNINMLQNAIEKKRDELLVQFSEQKKFEIALEQRQLAEFNEAKAREARMMDEVAIRGFSRRDDY